MAVCARHHEFRSSAGGGAMKRALIVVFALSLTLFADAQEPAATLPEQLAIDQLLLRWYEAIAAGNAAALADLVTDDVEFWGDGTPAITGKAAVVSSFTQTFERFLIRQVIEEKERIWDESFVVIRGIESSRISEKPIL